MVMAGSDEDNDGHVVVMLRSSVIMIVNSDGWR